MSLQELREKYEAGLIGKYEYVSLAYACHRQLFEYVSFLAGTNIRLIEISETGLVLQLRTPPVKMLCPPGDEHHTAIAMLNFRRLENSEFAMVCGLFQDGGAFFDIGANAGYYSLGIASSFPKARIVAIEPIPQTFAGLQRNIALNSFSNITAFNLGLADHQGEDTFYYNDTISGAASSCPTADQQARPVVCPVRTLDSMVESSNIGLDFIKCDVEGAELFVFRGGMQALEKYKPAIFSEMLRKWSARFHYHPNDIISLMERLGYRCFTLREDKLVACSTVTESTIETNFFFLHVQKHGRQIEQLSVQE